MFYDEAIEVYDEDDLDEYAQNKLQPGSSPLKKPLSSRQPPPLALPISQSRRNMIMTSSEENNKLSSKDFISTPRTSNSNLRGMDKSIISDNIDQSGESSPPSDAAVLPARRSMAELQKSNSKEQEHPTSSRTGNKLPTNSSGKSRPMSASQSQAPQRKAASPSEEDDDEEDDEEEDVNVAQIEGILQSYESKMKLDSQRREAEVQMAREYLYQETSEEITSGDSEIDESMLEHIMNARIPDPPMIPYLTDSMEDASSLPNLGPLTRFGPLRPSSFCDFENDGGPSKSYNNRRSVKAPQLIPRYLNMDDDYGILIDKALDCIPPPDPHPELNTDEDVLQYVKHKKLWEQQLEMKRDELETIRRLRPARSTPYGYALQEEDEDEEKVYNPVDYANLNVSPDIKEIFKYITQYALPSLNSQIDVKLHPFIPEYYPSVGDIDAFIKVVDPDIKDDGLGVKCLDEPAPYQSDQSVLDLRLRALAKQSSAKAVVVKKVENVGKNTKTIENWIKDISDLHRSKPSPSVHYSKPMPDIDLLIQEWPPEVEDLLKNLTLPSSDLNCDLATYSDIVCNLLDIPVYKSRIQSLHVLFTLYATQKQFSQYGPLGDAGGVGNNNDVDLMPSSSSAIQIREDNYDRLQLS